VSEALLQGGSWQEALTHELRDPKLLSLNAANGGPVVRMIAPFDSAIYVGHENPWVSREFLTQIAKCLARDLLIREAD
jgi:hypothetical protein